jgi:glucosamine-6-phosphate deaminase
VADAVVRFDEALKSPTTALNDSAKRCWGAGTSARRVNDNTKAPPKMAKRRAGLATMSPIKGRRDLKIKRRPRENGLRDCVSERRLGKVTFFLMEPNAQATAAPTPLRRFQVDALPVEIHASGSHLATAAAVMAKAALAGALAAKGSAAAILATGNSQIRFLKELIELGGVDWSKVTLFHMDEYLGISGGHKASFRRYMRERVESLVKPLKFEYIGGDADLPLDEIERYTAALKAQEIDLCCLGIGENGHIAFNDPPVARFDERHWVKLVKLDDDCKMQQVKEGHFPSLEAVPPYAYTLTIPALLAARRLICLSPEKRKSVPVQRALEGPVATSCPASVLRTAPHAVLLLDPDSASLLKNG